MSLPAGCLTYLLSVTTEHWIYKFDAMRQTGRDNIAGPGRESVSLINCHFKKMFAIAAFACVSFRTY